MLMFLATTSHYLVPFVVLYHKPTSPSIHTTNAGRTMQILGYDAPPPKERKPNWIWLIRHISHSAQAAPAIVGVANITG